jgi:monovalent cation:H+ antiporter-2, CPA2 family
VLIGHGLVGSLIGDFLKASGAPYVVIEVDDALAAGLAAAGARVVIGTAASAEVLAEAEIGTARQLIVAIPDAFEAGQVVQQARAANPDLAIVARADADAEAEHLADLGARSVITGERELARGMIEQLRRWNEGPA